MFQVKGLLLDSLYWFRVTSANAQGAFIPSEGAITAAMTSIARALIYLGL